MQLLRITDIARLLQVSRSKIRDKAQSGEYKDIVIMSDRLKLIPLQSVIDDVKLMIKKKEGALIKLKKGLDRLQKQIE